MLKNYFRSALFYIVYISSGIITGIVGCLFCPFMSINYRLKFLSYWPKFINWILYKLCDIEFEVIGQENIPEAPFVVVSNHQGQWETFFYQYFFFPLTTLLKRELLFIPIWGWALALLRPIAINRGSPRRALKKTILEGEKRIKAERLKSGIPLDEMTINEIPKCYDNLTGTIWAITTYFNPVKYRRKLDNFHNFLQIRNS